MLNHKMKDEKSRAAHYFLRAAQGELEDEIKTVKETDLAPRILERNNFFSSKLDTSPDTVQVH
jgi:dsDNA-specific endonuclease/ATPase MutS2